MRVVVIAMHPEPGHTIPTIPIAAALRCSGVTVIYLTSRVLAGFVHARGFLVETFETISHKVSPMSIVGYDSQVSGRSYWQQFGHGPVRAAYIHARLTKIAHDYQPALIILDHLFYRNYNLCSNGTLQGRPVIHLATSLPRWDEPLEHSKVPRWVLCPSVLELEGFVDPARQVNYGEPSIDWERPEISDSEETITKQLLVLYSPGSQVMMHTNAHARLAYIMEAARSFGDVKFIIATGGGHVQSRESSSYNVHIRNYIPQLALLKKASLLITHCGLGSIKEAICCGVPILGLPMVFDQPYNAMRIRKRGLGDAIFPEQMSTHRLCSAIGHILGNSQVEAKVEWMQQRFLEMEVARPFVNWVLARLSDTV